MTGQKLRQNWSFYWDFYKSSDPDCSECWWAMLYPRIFAPDGKSCGWASINYPLGQSCKLLEMRRVPAAQIVAFIGVLTKIYITHIAISHSATLDNRTTKAVTFCEKIRENWLFLEKFVP